MTGKGITLIRLIPGDYAGAGKGQQHRKATEASPCFENTVIFRGKPAVGKNMRCASLSSKYPVSSKIAMAIRRRQWTGPGSRAAAGQR